MLELYAVNCREPLSDKHFNSFISLIDKEKQIKIKRFLKYKDAQRALLSDILVRFLSCRELRVSNNKISFSYNVYGKPHIKGFNNFHFNITHSGDWVICGIGSKPLGIDIEYISLIDISSVRAFFSTDENKMLDSKPVDEQLEYFYDIWTLKESYLKFCGVGLSLSLNFFSVIKYENSIEFRSSIDLNTYYFKQYNIDKQYKLSSCSLDYKSSDINIIEEKDLYNFFISGGC